MATMFEQLLELPLFKGATLERMAQIVGDTKFHFMKYRHGETVVAKGEQCCDLMFVVSGVLRYSLVSEKAGFAVEQDLKAPAVVAPEFLFGMYTEMPCTAVALTDSSILRISKADYMRILSSDSVFLFNYLNLLSAKVQAPLMGMLSLPKISEVSGRIAIFTATMTQQGGSNIRLKSVQGLPLCKVFGVSEPDLDMALQPLKKANLLNYSQHEIEIVDRNEFLRHCQQ